jgi:hypothetical protein
MLHASLRNDEEVGMRGDDEIPEPMFNYVLPEQRVPQDHRCARSGPCWTRR